MWTSGSDTNTFCNFCDSCSKLKTLVVVILKKSYSGFHKKNYSFVAFNLEQRKHNILKKSAKQFVFHCFFLNYSCIVFTLFILHAPFLQLEVPIQVLHCADIVGLEDIRKPVAFLAKMVSCKAIAICLVRKGMLEAARMRRLLDDSSPKEVILDMLMIVSDLARKDVVSFLTISHFFCLCIF